MNTSLKFLRGDTATSGSGRPTSAKSLSSDRGQRNDNDSHQTHSNSGKPPVEHIEPYTDEQLRLMPIAHQYSS